MSTKPKKRARWSSVAIPGVPAKRRRRLAIWGPYEDGTWGLCVEDGEKHTVRDCVILTKAAVKRLVATLTRGT